MHVVKQQRQTEAAESVNSTFSLLCFQEPVSSVPFLSPEIDLVLGLVFLQDVEKQGGS